MTFGRNIEKFFKYSRIKYVCFSFHVRLLVITLLSLRLHTENNVCMFLLEILDGSVKSRF